MSSTVFFMLATLAFADPDPNGEWTWRTSSKDGEVDVTLKLEYADNKLTGKINGPQNTPKPINKASFKKDVIEFSVTRTPGKKRISAKYYGRIDGDTIKGTVEIDKYGDIERHDWVAKRKAARE